MSKPRRRRSRAKQSSGLPKGAYRVPGGGWVHGSAGQPVKPGRNGRQIRVVGVRREKPDLRRLALVLIEHARQEAEAARRNASDVDSMKR